MREVIEAIDGPIMLNVVPGFRQIVSQESEVPGASRLGAGADGHAECAFAGVDFRVGVGASAAVVHFAGDW